uniref:ricin-type beta-trefoil lectin domain protein n=1 Tax=Streptomyces sp. NRRL S-325 TaxID=1463899 RepID=UPI003B63C1AC
MSGRVGWQQCEQHAAADLDVHRRRQPEVDLLTGLSAAPASAAATATGPITGLAGKCVDVAGGAVANGTAVQLYDCNGTAAQQWTVGADGTIRALGRPASSGSRSPSSSATATATRSGTGTGR